MIVIDSSVWIEFFRGNPPIVEKVSQFIDENLIIMLAPIYFEVINGVSKKDFSILDYYISALPIIYPSDLIWKQVYNWIELSRRKGDSFGIMDMLIAEQTKDLGCKLWSLDKDFKRMVKLKMVDLWT